MRKTLRTAPQACVPHSPFPIPPSRPAFTLVELLVVIAIIAILASLLTVAAVGAINAAKRARIVAEMEQFNTAMEDHRNVVGSYPPNTQTDALAFAPHLNNASVLAAFKRHLKKVAPSHREPPELIEALVGMRPGGSQNTPANPNLPGGMNAAEALVFWLGGFSDDPQYPISGVGGPSYSIAPGSLGNVSVNDRHRADPVDNRSWKLDINIANLGPRDDAGFFDADPDDFGTSASDDRFLEYNDPRNPGQARRINFWYLKAPGSSQPYVYFDASRGSAVTADNDPPAAVFPTDTVLQYGDPALRDLYFVQAIKRLNSDASADERFLFANDGKFQILHCGLDDRWGSFPTANEAVPAGLVDSKPWHSDPPKQEVALVLTHAEGPWTLDLADTIANFAGGALEDAR